MGGIRVLSGLSALVTLAIMILGAAVRATDSGLSCPDWPTCYGRWIPLPGDIPPEAGYAYYQVLLEWVHRLLVGVVLGPLVLVTALWAWRKRGSDPALGTYGAAALLLLLAQAAMGGVTVLDRNSPWSVAVHLVLAMLLLTVLLLLFDRSRGALWRAEDGFRRLRLPAVAAWALLLAASASAAVVAKSGASLACPDWPLCEGRLFPAASNPLVHLQLGHRWLAAAALFAVAVLALRAWPVPRARWLALVGFAFALVTALLAGHAIAFLWPVWAQVVHQALAVLALLHVSLVLARSLHARAGAVGEAAGVPA